MRSNSREGMRISTRKHASGSPLAFANDRHNRNRPASPSHLKIDTRNANGGESNASRRLGTVSTPGGGSITSGRNTRNNTPLGSTKAPLPRIGKDTLKNSQFLPTNRRKKMTQRLRRSNSIPSLRRKLEQRGITGLSEDTVVELKHIYTLLDINCDGHITEDEIISSFKVLEMEWDNDLLRRMITTHNTRGDDHGLELDDFIEMCVKMGIVQDDKVKTFVDEDEHESDVALFHIFDSASKDGRLTEQELRDRLEDITGKNFAMRDVQRMLEEIDEDSDGLLDLSEFIELMKYLERKKKSNSEEERQKKN
eukprot:CAMPEP_0117439328 /NCGR_PEP_ID=MMETSP0759-20121206/2509_1 /TAXON_ID=63605 /ORGANISM="Percolomonas cosmopolitus, Strain WS" /LENGTH=308 /DNA_ID=CAMNT_0005231041 /DNA_START=177 /DNA_END=1103 /DNA_ORIENTATION=-